MSSNLRIVLIMMCVIFIGFASANKDEIRSQSTGSSQKDFKDFIAKQTVVSVITPTGSLLIDCRHENPNTRVSLLFTRALDKPFLDVTKKGNIVQLAQVFMLTEVNTGDDGYYMCARKDGNGKGKIVVEVFVMEEETIYSGFSNLKHAFEDQDIEKIETFVKSTNSEGTSIGEPSERDEEDMMKIIQQQSVAIREDTRGSINQNVLDHVTLSANMTLSHVPSFIPSHLPTQNDHVTSFTQDNQTTQNVLVHMRSSSNGTPCLVSPFIKYQLDTQYVLGHVTSFWDNTPGHLSSIKKYQLHELTPVTNMSSTVTDRPSPKLPWIP